MTFLGAFIIILTAFAGTSFLKDFLRSRFPGFREGYFDTIILVLGTFALFCYFYAEYKNKILTNKVDLLEYQDISAYSATGNKAGKVNGVPMFPTPIIDWSKDFVTKEDSKINAECSSLV